MYRIVGKYKPNVPPWYKHFFFGMYILYLTIPALTYTSCIYNAYEIPILHPQKTSLCLKVHSFQSYCNLIIQNSSSTSYFSKHLLSDFLIGSVRVNSPRGILCVKSFCSIFFSLVFYFVEDRSFCFVS